MNNAEESREKEATRRIERHEWEKERSVEVSRQPVRAGHTWSRAALIWLFAACVPGLVIGIALHYFSVAPLEKRLLEVQARQTAKELDAVVQMRRAAIQIAAGTSGSTKLVETKELDRLLQALRGAFPDFLSMEILDEHGDILAMVGELPLSEAAKSVGKSKTAKVGTMLYRDRDLFRDDPESDSFVLTVKHKSQEGKAWFTRTRFAREPIKQALASTQDGVVATLIPLPEGEAGGSTTPGAGLQNGKSAMTVKLDVPGWALNVTKRVPHTMLPWGTGIAAGLVAVMIGLALLYRRFSARSILSSPAVTASSESVPRQQPVSGAAGKLDPSVEPEEDLWSPRNVPLGCEEPPEAEIVATCTPEELEDIGWRFGEDEPDELCTASQSSDEDPTLVLGAEDNRPELPDITVLATPVGPEAGKDSEHEPAGPASGAEIPEILDVEWFEAGPSHSPDIQVDEPDTAQAMEGFLSSHEEASLDEVTDEIPEVLDVTWLEPDPILPQQCQSEAEEKEASRTSTVIPPVA